MDRASSGIFTRRMSRKVHGFSLLEILVAFTLLALAMGILMQIFSRGVNGAGLADKYAKATMMAESKLAAVGVENILQAGETTGKFDDDFQWRLLVTPYVEPVAKDVAVNPADIEALMATRLYEVALTVSFQSDDSRERQVTLNTLLIGAKT